MCSGQMVVSVFDSAIQLIEQEQEFFEVLDKYAKKHALILHFQPEMFWVGTFRWRKAGQRTENRNALPVCYTSGDGRTVLGQYGWYLSDSRAFNTRNTRNALSILSNDTGRTDRSQHDRRNCSFLNDLSRNVCGAVCVNKCPATHRVKCVKNSQQNSLYKMSQTRGG
jgi:hypothetical protein